MGELAGQIDQVRPGRIVYPVGVLGHVGQLIGQSLNPVAIAEFGDLVQIGERDAERFADIANGTA